MWLLYKTCLGSHQILLLWEACNFIFLICIIYIPWGPHACDCNSSFEHFLSISIITKMPPFFCVCKMLQPMPNFTKVSPYSLVCMLVSLLLLFILGCYGLVLVFTKALHSWWHFFIIACAMFGMPRPFFCCICIAVYAGWWDAWRTTCKMVCCKAIWALERKPRCLKVVWRLEQPLAKWFIARYFEA